MLPEPSPGAPVCVFWFTGIKLARSFAALREFVPEGAPVEFVVSRAGFRFLVRLLWRVAHRCRGLRPQLQKKWAASTLHLAKISRVGKGA